MASKAKNGEIFVRREFCKFERGGNPASQKPQEKKKNCQKNFGNFFSVVQLLACNFEGYFEIVESLLTKYGEIEENEIFLEKKKNIFEEFLFECKNAQKRSYFGLFERLMEVSIKNFEAKKSEIFGDYLNQEKELWRGYPLIKSTKSKSNEEDEKIKEDRKIHEKNFLIFGGATTIHKRTERVYGRAAFNQGDSIIENPKNQKNILKNSKPVNSLFPSSIIQTEEINPNNCYPELKITKPNPKPQILIFL